MGAPQASEAHTLGARAGKPLGNTACWSAFGPAMTNVCSSAEFWNVQLLDPPCGVFGCSSVTVTVVAAQFGSDVQCRTIGWSKTGLAFSNSGFRTPTQFGVPADITISASTPGGGVQDVDCQVASGSQVITLTW